MNLTYFKQSGFLFESDGRNIYIDPFGIRDDEPLADAIFISHAHYDHFDPSSIDRIRKSDTLIYCPTDVSYEIPLSNAVAPGDSIDVFGVSVEAVPAYNVREDRASFHPRANNWLGFIFKFPGSTVYHAGDTDQIPEMEGIETDLALLPIGGTYTMDAHEAAEAARTIKPRKAVLPMHYAAVVGTKEDAEDFAKAALPVQTEIISPKYR